jgi:Mlc titration factor MtfA (ptsG expression regulator)
MLFSWFKRRRRKKLLQGPFPDAWWEHVARNVRHARHLPRNWHARYRDRIRVMVAEKTWLGGGGLEVDEEMMVTVSAGACVMIAAIEGEYYWDGVQTIILHPGAYRWPTDNRRDGLIVDENVEMEGEAWHRGPIVLSWEAVVQEGRSTGDGSNLVFHEFAHHLDGLDGVVEGTPPLGDREKVRNWYRVTEEEFQRLSESADRGEATLLDHYGAHDPAEFFAVSTECFFERPHEMRRRHGALHALLRDFYRQDPADWMPDTTRRLRRRAPVS